MTRPTWTAATTEDSCTKKFPATSHTLSPFSIKEAWATTLVRWLFGTLANHLLSLLTLWIKLLFLALTTCLLIYWPVMQQTGEGDGTPLQYSCLENPMDRGVWQAVVHGATKGQTQLSDFISLFTFMHWRRKWQPTPGFLPGESQGQRSLVGCRLWGCTVRHSWCNAAAAAAAVAHSKQYELGLSNTMAAVKISTDNKIWWRCINKGNLVHCWWKCKLMQPQWKTVWRFLKN